MDRFSRGALILLFVLLPAEALPAQTIRGRVVAEDGRDLNHPIEVHVEIQGRVISRVYTNGFGFFTTDDLRVATSVDLVVEERGFRPARVEAIVRRPNSRVAPLEVIISLEPVASGREPVAAGAVDLGQLGVLPDEAVSAFERGVRHAADGEYENATQLLEEAVEGAPRFYAAQNALGALYQRLGRREDATRHFLIARDLNPNAAPPALSLGIMSLEDSDRESADGNPDAARRALDQALGHLEDAIERDPRSALGQYYLGGAHYRAGAVENAASRLHRALDLDSQLHDVRLLLFNVYLDQENYELALEQVTTYLESYPDSPLRATVEQALEQTREEMEYRASRPPQR